jgi:hypothetical protein
MKPINGRVFHTDLGEWDESALQELISIWFTSLTKKTLIRSHAGLPRGISQAAIRVFRFTPELRPAPVDNWFGQDARNILS